MGQVKWTPENDQLLLVKILETHDLSVDVNAVAETWPTDEPRPTPRAIRERIFKIKSTIKSVAQNVENPDSNGNEGSAVTDPATSPTTPKKRRAVAGSARKTPAKGTPTTPKTPRKRKRATKSPSPGHAVKSDPDLETDPHVKPEPTGDDAQMFPADTQQFAGEAAALLDQFQEASAVQAESEQIGNVDVPPLTEA